MPSNWQICPAHFQVFDLQSLPFPCCTLGLGIRPSIPSHPSMEHFALPCVCVCVCGRERERGVAGIKQRHADGGNLQAALGPIANFS
jgi:hypothetical protein